LGKDRNEIFRGTIHSSFRLGETNGGFIALVAPDGVTILDQVADYAKQRLGRLYGRDAGANGLTLPRASLVSLTNFPLAIL